MQPNVQLEPTRKTMACVHVDFFFKRLFWRQAADQCYALGARLPEVKSAKENADILSVKV